MVFDDKDEVIGEGDEEEEDEVSQNLYFIMLVWNYIYLGDYII